MPAVSLLKPIDRTREYQLFELHNRQIFIAAFDSIHSNDCFRLIPVQYHAARSLDAISTCAIFHTHMISKSPSCVTASRVLRYVKTTWTSVKFTKWWDCGFQLGLHGHQHVAAAATHYVHLSETQSMAVVSAELLMCLSARTSAWRQSANTMSSLSKITFVARACMLVKWLKESSSLAKAIAHLSEGFIELNWQTPVRCQLGQPIDFSGAKHSFEQHSWLKMRSALTILAVLVTPARCDACCLSGSHARKIAIQAALTSTNLFSSLRR